MRMRETINVLQYFPFSIIWLTKVFKTHGFHFQSSNKLYNFFNMLILQQKLGVSVSTLKRRQSELKISWPRRLTDKGSKKRGDSSVYDDESIDSSFEESSNLESDLFKSSSSSDTDASILIRETKSESSTPAFEESPSPRERQFQFIVPPVVDASQIPENFVLPYYGGDSRFNMGFSFELSMLTNEFFQNMKDELFNMYKEWEHRQRCNTNI